MRICNIKRGYSPKVEQVVILLGFSINEEKTENNKELILTSSLNTENEKWKLIEKLNNLYAISTLGRVMSMRTGMIMKPSTKKDGYKLLIAKINGEQKGIHVHRLVAEAFLPNPDNLPVINHKDENPANNEISNLEWCTWQYNNTYNNINKRKKESHIAWNKGKSMKKDSSIIHMITKDISMCFSCISKAAEYISEKHNIKFQTAYSGIYKALNRNNNNYHGYRWSYE